MHKWGGGMAPELNKTICNRHTQPGCGFGWQALRQRQMANTSSAAAGVTGGTLMVKKKTGKDGKRNYPSRTTASQSHPLAFCKLVGGALATSWGEKFGGLAPGWPAPFRKFIAIPFDCPSSNHRKFNIRRFQTSDGRWKGCPPPPAKMFSSRRHFETLKKCAEVGQKSLYPKFDTKLDQNVAPRCGPPPSNDH